MFLTGEWFVDDFSDSSISHLEKPVGPLGDYRVMSNHHDCRMFLSGLFPRHFAGLPQPGRGAAIEALRELQNERNRALAALAEKERAAMDALARGEKSQSNQATSPPSDK